MRGLGDTSPLVVAIANAISQMESGGSATALSYRNNNPGNLVTWGSNPIVNGFAQFPTLAAGWTALYSQVQTNINRGLNLYQFFAGGLGYAGYASAGSSASNDPNAYALFVSQKTGIDPNVPLNTVDPNTLQSTAAPISTTPALPCDPTADPTCTGSDASGNPCDPTSDPNCPGYSPSGGSSGAGSTETIVIVAAIALAVWILWE
jgi:hypothetical protein